MERGLIAIWRLLFLITLYYPWVWAWRLFKYLFVLTADLWGNTYKWLSGSKKSNIHGDADWAKKEDLNRSGGFVVAHDGKPIFTGPEARLLMFAQPGAGKSLVFGASIRRDTRHILCLDPAGDHYREHAQYLRDRGAVVKEISLTAPGFGYDGMTLLKLTSDWDIDDYVAKLCEWGIPDDDVKTNQHFIDMPRILLAAVIKAEYRHFKTHKTFAECCNFLATASGEELTHYWAKCRALPDEPLIRAAIKAYESVGDREKGSFVSTVTRKLRPWQMPPVMSMKDTWKWEDVLLSPVQHVIFLRVGMGDNPIRAAYTRMVVGACMSTVERIYNQTGEPLAIGLNLYGEEAELIGRCKPIYTAITQLRKARVNIALIYQGIEQIYEAYGREIGDVIIGACSLWTAGGLKSVKTYKMFSDLIGTRTVSSVSKSKGQQGKTETEYEAAQKVITVDQLFAMPFGEVVCILGNKAVKGKLPAVIRGRKPNEWVDYL